MHCHSDQVENLARSAGTIDISRWLTQESTGPYKARIMETGHSALGWGYIQLESAGKLPAKIGVGCRRPSGGKGRRFGGAYRGFGLGGRPFIVRFSVSYRPSQQEAQRQHSGKGGRWTMHLRDNLLVENLRRQRFPSSILALHSHCWIDS